MIISRRSLFGLLAAPAIIKVADLMPIKALPSHTILTWEDVDYATSHVISDELAADRLVVPQGIRMVRAYATMRFGVPKDKEGLLFIAGHQMKRVGEDELGAHYEAEIPVDTLPALSQISLPPQPALDLKFNWKISPTRRKV